MISAYILFAMIENNLRRIGNKIVRATLGLYNKLIRKLYR